MISKTTQHFAFDVNLNWLTDNKGILSGKKVNGSIHVATPPEFGGEGKPWTPEHLFLGAISSCFMTTYLVFAKKLHFEISDFECSAIGQVEIIDGRYKFTTIDLYPKIFIADEALREKANLAIEKTHKHCLISNSVNADIYYHSQVFLATFEETGSQLKPDTPKIIHTEFNNETQQKKAL